MNVFSPYQSKSNDFMDDVFGYGGIGVGQEYFFGVKGSVIKPFAFQKRARKPKYGLYPLGAYAGLEANGFSLFAAWGGVGVNGGFTVSNFTMDCSLMNWYAVGPDGQKVPSQQSLNPKLGLRMGPVWLKAGPSFLLSQDSFAPEQLKIGRLNYNFELNILPKRG